jgi:hypothetical protein
MVNAIRTLAAIGTAILATLAVHVGLAAYPQLANFASVGATLALWLRLPFLKP